MSLLRDLLSAAKRHLRGCRRSSALSLAAHLLAVDCGIKPCLLYDSGAEDVLTLQRYIRDLHHIGLIQGPLHIVNMEGTILILNVQRAASDLLTLLHSGDLHVIDVSAALRTPEVLAPGGLQSIQSHLSDLLTHLTPYRTELAGSFSVSDLPAPEWNLCTIFGFLLHYPAVYWFDTSRNQENCLSFTPLRHVTIEATCPTIGLQNLPLFSFTIPESVYHTVQLSLQTWTERLRRTFGGQRHFTDLNVIMETVTLPAVAL